MINPYSSIQAATTAFPLRKVAPDVLRRDTESKCAVCFDELFDKTRSDAEQLTVVGHPRTAVVDSASEKDESFHFIHQGCYQELREAQAATLLEDRIVNPWPPLSCPTCQVPVKSESTSKRKTEPGLAKALSLAFLKTAIEALIPETVAALTTRIDAFVTKSNSFSSLESHDNPLIKYGSKVLWKVSVIASNCFLQMKAAEFTARILPVELQKADLCLAFTKATSSEEQMNNLRQRDIRFCTTFPFYLAANECLKHINKNHSEQEGFSIRKHLISTSLFAGSLTADFEWRLYQSTWREFAKETVHGGSLSDPRYKEKLKSILSTPTIAEAEASLGEALFAKAMSGRKDLYLEARKQFTRHAVSLNETFFSTLQIPWINIPFPIVRALHLELSLQCLFSSNLSLSRKRILLCLAEEHAGDLFYQHVKNECLKKGISTREIDQAEVVTANNRVVLDWIFDIIEKDAAKNNPSFTEKLKELITSNYPEFFATSVKEEGLETSSFEDWCKTLSSSFALNFIPPWLRQDKQFKKKVDIEEEMQKAVRNLFLEKQEKTQEAKASSI